MAVVEHGRFPSDRLVSIIELEVTLPEVGVGFVLVPPERVVPFPVDPLNLVVIVLGVVQEVELDAKFGRLRGIRLSQQNLGIDRCADLVSPDRTRRVPDVAAPALVAQPRLDLTVSGVLVE